MCPRGGRNPLQEKDFQGGGGSKAEVGDCARKSFAGPEAASDRISGRKNTAGVFTVLCAKHHTVLGACRCPTPPRATLWGCASLFALSPVHTGYFIMRSGESVAQVLGFLGSYGLDLDVVHYDRACALEVNASGRLASLFADCRFVLDSLHKWSHSCGQGFKVRHDGGDERVNNEICESMHAKLRSCNAGTENMRFSTVLQMLTLFYCFLNAAKRWEAGPRSDSAPHL